MPIQKETLGWLVGCPASDINFKNHCAEANLETCEAALLNETLTKTARAAIEARLRKLTKLSPHPAARNAEAGAPSVKGHSDQSPAPGKFAAIKARWSKRKVEAGAREITLGDLDVMPPARKGPANPDAEMGEELTAQYHRATGGMVEVLKFGAMMIEFEHTLESDSTRGVAPKSGSPKTKGTGFKAWLKEHAPDIKEGTAYRLKAVTESIVVDYESIVGKKIAKAYSLPALVNSSTDELPADVAAKQLELFNFVSGTSQRSWLDRFKPAPRLGGKTYERDGVKGVRKELPADHEMRVAVDLWTPTMRFLAEDGLHEKTWAHLPDAMMRELKGLLIDLNKLVPAK